MTGYCNSCGAPISGNFKFCTVCSGNRDQGSDDYAERFEREAEQQRQSEREAQEVYHGDIDGDGQL